MEKKMVPESEEKSSWSNLQLDMLSLIKSHLFASDIATFNMICKPWRSVTPRRVFPPPPIDSPMAHTPCLATLHDNVCEFYHPLYNVTYKLDTHPELSNARIRSSGHGWLLMSQGLHNQFFFYNPFTKEKINLPHVPRPLQLMLITFSSPPTSPDCFVIALEFGKAITIRRGDEFWKFREISIMDFLLGPYCSPVVLNGKCYFLGEIATIGEYDVTKNTWEVYGDAWPRGITHPFSMVSEKDGVFLAVFLSREHRQVRVRRFDLSKKVWEDVEGLGSNKMLYASDGTSFLETSAATTTGMGNKIYFPIFDRGNIGVFYNLSTKKYHSYDGKYCNKYRFNVVEPRFSTWIKPVYTTTVGIEEFKW